MNLRKILILRKQFRKKDAELKKERGKQKNKKLTGEVLRLNNAVCAAMAQLSKEDMARFHKVVEKECNAFVRKMGSKLWVVEA
jgi:hypothetical protein